MMDRYEPVRNLIEQHSNIAEFGDGVSDAWVEKAEAAIGLPLPDTYKWWLRNYGGGEVGGDEVFGIYELDFDTVVGGDIVYMYRLSVQEPDACTTQIPLCYRDIDGAFWFDTSSGLQDNEYPVIPQATEAVYSRDFLEFIEKRIELCQ